MDQSSDPLFHHQCDESHYSHDYDKNLVATLGIPLTESYLLSSKIDRRNTFLHLYIHSSVNLQINTILWRRMLLLLIIFFWTAMPSPATQIGQTACIGATLADQSFPIEDQNLHGWSLLIYFFVLHNSYIDQQLPHFIWTSIPIKSKLTCPLWHWCLVSYAPRSIADVW